MVLFEGCATGEHMGSPLRILTIVQQVSARPVVAPYGGARSCVKQFDKHLFDGGAAGAHVGAPSKTVDIPQLLLGMGSMIF